MSTALLLLLVTSMIVVGTGATVAQGQGEINIVLEPTEQGVAPGEEITYDINIEGADNDVSAYDLTIDIDNTNVAKITRGELIEFGGDLVGTVSVDEDGSSIQFEEAVGNQDAGEEDFTLATVTVTAADGDGDTTLSISKAQVNDNDLDTYENNELGDATVNLEADNGAEEPTDDEMPSFSAAVTLIALIGASLLIYRRQE